MSLFRSCSFYKMHSWNRNCGIGTACRLDVLFYAVADDLIKNITFYAYMKTKWQANTQVTSVNMIVCRFSASAWV